MVILGVSAVSHERGTPVNHVLLAVSHICQLSASAYQLSRVNFRAGQLPRQGAVTDLALAENDG